MFGWDVIVKSVLEKTNLNLLYGLLKQKCQYLVLKFENFCDFRTLTISHEKYIITMGDTNNPFTAFLKFLNTDLDSLNVKGNIVGR